MVPAGALALSDPVCLQVPPLTDVAVSIYLPVSTTASTTHIVAMQTNYVAASTGNFADATDLPGATITGEWDFLTGVDVIDAAREGAIVTLGDSATDGIGSTPDANKRWPDILAKRLQARSRFEHVAVLNEAITGNRILHPGQPMLGFRPRCARTIRSGRTGAGGCEILDCIHRVGRHCSSWYSSSCFGGGQRSRRNRRSAATNHTCPRKGDCRLRLYSDAVQGFPP